MRTHSGCTRRLARSLAAASLLALAASLLALAAAPSATAQDTDNAVFKYTRFELDATRSQGPTVASWEASGWIGTDFDRLWWRSFGERAAGSFNEGEIQLLYGRYVRLFWDAVVGYRREFRPAGTSFVAAGIHGLAPYWFEVSLLAFVSERGKLGARVQADTDWFLTQRLIALPAVRVDWDASADPRRARPAGFNYAEFALRLRYEIERKLAPYLDLHYIREAGEAGAESRFGETEGLRLGAGVRLIF